MARLGEMEDIPSGAGFADAATRFYLERDSPTPPRNYSRAKLDHSFCQFAPRRPSGLPGRSMTCRGADRPRASRFAGRGATIGHRGAAQGRADQGAMRDSTLELGIDMGAVRSRCADRVAALGGERNAAHWPRRPPRGCSQRGHSLSQVPRRPWLLAPRSRAPCTRATLSRRAFRAIHWTCCASNWWPLWRPARPPKDARPSKARKTSRRGKNLAANLQFDGFDSTGIQIADAPKPEVSVDFLFDLIRGAAPLARFRARRSTVCSICSAAAIPPMSSASCVRGSRGIACAMW